jgi:hypothetical protein
MQKTHFACCQSLSFKARFCPHCGARIEQRTVGVQPSATEGESIERVKEIAIDNLCAKDSLLIQTSNSVYNFSVTDPVNRMGILSVGVDANGREVTLVGMRFKDDRGVRSDPSRLATNSCALFYVSVGNSVKSIITSTITGLTHIRSRSSRNTLS